MAVCDFVRVVVFKHLQCHKTLASLAYLHRPGGKKRAPHSDAFSRRTHDNRTQHSPTWRPVPRLA